MRTLSTALAILPALLLGLAAGQTDAIETDPFWRVICSSSPEHTVTLAALSAVNVPPVKHCGPQPTTFQELPHAGAGGDTTVMLDVGFDAASSTLCFIDNHLASAPVIRVGAGHKLTIQLTNTLHNSGPLHELNCPIQTFTGEATCGGTKVFQGVPGADGPYYPLLANQAHRADGTTNLHTHGLFVSPQPCSDEVLQSTVYPANWIAPTVPLQPCQTSANTLTYTYNLPPDHPSGLYWYHTHRHGSAEVQTQMGLVGAIVVEDGSDAQRRAIGVTDEVLIVTDTPLNCNITACSDAVAARAAQPAAKPAVAASGPALDPRIDEVNQAGGCAVGATGSAGGYELWSLLLNGAPVAENQGVLWPPNFRVLSKTMQPGQRQLFRLVNASANSFIAPQLAVLHNETLTVLPLEVYARDGVGLADANGNRQFGIFDVAANPVIVPPSGRIEFVVHAPAVGDTLYLQSSQVFPGCGGNLYPERRLLRIAATGTPVAPGVADDSDLLGESGHLHNYLSSLGSAASVQRTFVLSEYARPFTYGVTKWLNGPPRAADYNPTLVDFYFTEVAASDGSVDPSKTALIPFSSHTMAPQVTVHLHGKESVTEDWLIENATLEIHAFHIHQIHFRDVTVDSADPTQQPVLDAQTVPAAQLVGDVSTGYPGAPGWVKLRMTFTKADVGEFVYHCHILEHEDSGMMGKIKVVAD